MSPPAQLAPAESDWKAAVDAALRDPCLRSATVGIVVRRVPLGEILLSRNADRALIPASNQKLATAAAALALLGPDHRHRTRVVGAPGAVWLVGDGDPTVTTTDLGRLARSTAERLPRGARIVVHADESVFEPDHLGAAWQWDDEVYGFSAPFGGLVRDRSTATVTVRPGPAGTRARIDFPRGAGLLEGTVTCVPGTEARIVVSRDHSTQGTVVSGTLGTDAGTWTSEFAVVDPARWALAGFVDALRSEGVDAEEGCVCAAPSTATPVADHLSEPLSRRIREFLMPSDNLFGECLLRTLGRGSFGQGTAGAGAIQVRRWCEERGLPLAGVHIADGSGLSMHDSLTSDFVAALLLDRASDPAFVGAFPTAGKDGTMRSRLAGTFGEGRVVAKTGTLSVASSLSGYVRTRAGETVVFSLLMNQFDRSSGSRAARAVQDRVVLALLEIPPVRSSRRQSERSIR